MFSDVWKPHDFQHFDGIQQASPSSGETTGPRPGTTLKLSVNCFRLVFKAIYHYHYTIQGHPDVEPKEERRILERAWHHLEKHLENFCIRLPGHIFSPKKVDEEFTIQLQKEGLTDYTLTVSLHETLTGRCTGAASVVGEHIIHQLATLRMAQKVGRRLYKEQSVAEAGKGSLNMHSLNVVQSRGLQGPLMQLDLFHRPVHDKSVIDVLRSIMPGTDIFAHKLEKEIKTEWLRCVSATVETSYNSRIYKIKSVHFDKDPNSHFMMRRKGEDDVEISFLQYLKYFYSCDVKCPAQPLLEAYADKASERVFLLPEFCHLAGIDEETVNHKTRLTETLKKLKASPQERFDAILQRVATGFKDHEICKKWNVQLEEKDHLPQALSVEGRSLANRWQVSFESGSKFPVDEEGTFARWLRHGLQDPRDIENWLLIFPEMDEPVLDVWVKSLQTTAWSGFNMKLGDPRREMVTQQRPLAENLQHWVTPQTQFVLLLLPATESWKAYRNFKEWMCCRMATPSQVIKSDTIRKRQSTGVILARIVQQMNAKSWGPLWHVEPEGQETEAFAAFVSQPVMILGINVYETSMGHRWLGLVASLNQPFSQYYSMAKECTESGSLSSILQHLFREALVAFAEYNDGQLPQRFVVYRAFVGVKEFPVLEALEFKAMKSVLELVRPQGGATEPAASARYSPEMTYIAVGKKDDMRIFALRPDFANIANPESGTVVDDPKLSTSEFPSFYAINQNTSKGTAVPAHFTVLKKPSAMTLDFVQALTYRLSLLYYNSNSAVRLPAPVMYAKRLTEFVATVLRKEPQVNLSQTLFYL